MQLIKTTPCPRAAIRRGHCQCQNTHNMLTGPKTTGSTRGPNPPANLADCERLSGNFSVRTHNARGRRSDTSRTAGQAGRPGRKAGSLPLCGCVAGIFRSKSCRVIKSAYYIITSSVAELGPRLCTQRERGRQTNRQAKRLTNWQTDKLTDRRTYSPSISSIDSRLVSTAFFFCVFACWTFGLGFITAKVC